jgi:hypothetical protein
VQSCSLRGRRGNGGPPDLTPMRTHIRPHAPTPTLRHACARARTHVHANTLTVCTQADADGTGGLLSILAADDSPQATRKPTLPELRVDFMQQARAMFGGNVDFDFATQLLQVARSSPCACACLMRRTCHGPCARTAGIRFERGERLRCVLNRGI